VSASRRAFWVRSGLLGLVVFALLAFTLHSLRLSDASFATASANTSNVFIAGTLGHINNQNGRVMLDVSNMEPGVSLDGTLMLTGTGSLAGDYTLTPSNLVNSRSLPALSDELIITIEDIATGTTLYDDDVTTFMTADPPDLGTIAPTQTRSYHVTLSYPDGPNEGLLQGATMSLVLQVTGVSQ
jgi:spore coat-associated protein N